MTTPDKRRDDPDTFVFDFLLGRLALHPEGRCLSQFSKEKNILFKFQWGDVSAEWDYGRNTIYCDRSLNRDGVLGLMARELRHAKQMSDRPGLRNVRNRRLAGTQMRKQVVLWRAMEQDACSYELCVRMALQKESVIADAAASMLGLTRKQVEKLNRGGSPGKTHDPVREVYEFAKEFRKKHSDDYFSPEARREAFLFFQRSLFFKRDLDEKMMARFRPHTQGKPPTAEAFAFAASRPLPDIADAVRRMSDCTIYSDMGKYLSPGMAAVFETEMLKDINPRLLRMLEAADALVAKAELKAKKPAPKA